MKRIMVASYSGN